MGMRNCRFRVQPLALILLALAPPASSTAQGAVGLRAAAERQMQASARLHAVASIETARPSEPMPCGKVRAISAPIGAAAGSLAGLLLHLALGSTGDGPEATRDQAFDKGISDRLTFVLVGGGLGAVWGMVAPPTARRCWFTFRGRPTDDGRGPEPGPPKLPKTPAT